MNILLIGNGAWGKNYVSIFEKLPIKLEIADRNNWKQKIDDHPDGVIVCTPPQTHVEIADYALVKNIPTMIEKPLSLSLQEAECLKKYDTPILVNHIHLFSKAYQNIKTIVRNNYITSISTLGYNKTPNRNYSSLWDYGPHDLSIILDLLQQFPKKIHVVEKDSLYHINLYFDTCSTTSVIGNTGKTKSRSLSINFDGLTLSYDDTCRPENHFSPLLNAVTVFIDAINGKKDDRLGLELSLQILHILEICHEQLQNSGYMQVLA